MDTYTPTYTPTSPTSPSLLGPHHLVHRPGSPEAFLFKATAPVRQNFAFSAQLPEEHPLFGDSVSRYHDLLFPIESLRRTMLFAARRYFRVPADRRTVLGCAGAAITGPDAWRRDGAGTRIALDLGMTPLDVVGGVPRGLECEAAVSIDGERCGTASARLVFPVQGVRPGGAVLGRPESEESAAAEGGVPASPGVPLPEQVGHLDSRHVLVGLPAYAGAEGGDGLVFPVHAPAAAGVPSEVPGVMEPTLFLEVSRQVGLLAAAELRGFVPSYAVLSRWQASFEGVAESALPLRCAVREEARRADGRVSRDAEGRPVIDLRMSFSQGSRVVARVSAAVLQDC
ncbi:AfsA-related hotdog domain-containing protein [Streptomyces sp. NPDC020996]|uniref:AfsA-related hotdog domain-containing protein n=1 Tax=Streptomyces sp. NPDC020996 TaxID=3154791 RepID=UPI0033D5EF71